MTIIELPARDASRLVPLLRQLHAFHAERDAETQTPAATDKDLADWLQNWLSRDATHALAVPADGDRLAAYALYQIEQRAPSPLRDAQTYGVLHHICVAPGHQRQGLALSLITEVKTRLTQQAIPSLRASHASFNTASAALMAKAGLSPFSVTLEVSLGTS